MIPISFLTLKFRLLEEKMKDFKQELEEYRKLLDSYIPQASDTAKERVVRCATCLKEMSSGEFFLIHREKCKLADEKPAEESEQCPFCQNGKCSCLPSATQVKSEKDEFRKALLDFLARHVISSEAEHAYQELYKRFLPSRL